MPEFVLDTSGSVTMTWTWDNLDDFTRGYIEAMFFTENEPGTTREQRLNRHGNVRKSWTKAVEEGQRKDVPGDYGFGDLSGDALTKIITICAEFQAVNCDDLEEAIDAGRIKGYDEQRAGNDYWYTRNGHGAGYWDRDLGDVGDRLTDASRDPEISPYVGDDGKIYI